MFRNWCIGALLIFVAGTAAAEPKSNMAAVDKGVAAEFGAPMEPVVGDEVCFKPDYCQGYISNVQVQAMGGLVTLLPTSMDPFDLYLRACSAALAGLAGTSGDRAAAYIKDAFLSAQREGRVKGEVRGVEVEVRPYLGGELLCEFFRR